MDGVRTGRQDSQSLGQAGSRGRYRIICLHGSASMVLVEDTVLSALPASMGQSHLASSGPEERSSVAC